MAESWKSVRGYEGLYKISSNGRVKSLHFGEKLLKKIAHTGGYQYVNLYKRNQSKKFYIHRLVAEHFLDNTENKPEVNHINGDKTDNRTTNLEWVTSAENSEHASEYNLVGTRTLINQYTLSGEFLRTYDSIAKASQATGINYSAIRSAVSGSHKSSGGFIWRRYVGESSNLNIKPHSILGTVNNTKKVAQYNGSGEILDVYNSIAEASRKTGIGYSALSKCVTGVNKSSGGFIWKYVY